MTKARLGLIIPKRFAKQAVLRNLVKRQIREVFRTRITPLPPEDLVVRLVRTMKDLPVHRDARRRWVRDHVEPLFNRLIPGTE